MVSEGLDEKVISEGRPGWGGEGGLCTPGERELQAEGTGGVKV